MSTSYAAKASAGLSQQAPQNGAKPAGPAAPSRQNGAPGGSSKRQGSSVQTTVGFHVPNDRIMFIGMVLIGHKVEVLVSWCSSQTGVWVLRS